MLPRPEIDPRWLPSLEDYERRLACRIAFVAAILTLGVVPAYHLIEWLVIDITPSLLWQHGAWRAQAMVIAIVVLVWHSRSAEGRGGGLMLSLLALSLMTMMFGLFFSNILAADGEPGRTVYGLIMTTFAISLISLRGWQELAINFSLPLVALLIGMNLAGANMPEAATLLIEPMMMLGVGLIASEILFRTRLQSFLASQELKLLASTDPLTGLNNRRSVEPQLDGEVSRARRHKTHFSVLIADLDRFKRVNDQYGHMIGDGVLCEVARRIESILRKEDRAARWGGEEFLVLLPETDPEQAEIVAEKIRQAIADRPMAINGFSIPLTISIGIASWSEDRDAENLIRRADQALYQAKESGRNRVCVDRSAGRLCSAAS